MKEASGITGYEQCKILHKFFLSVTELCNAELDVLSAQDILTQIKLEVKGNQKELDTVKVQPTEKYNDIATGILYHFMGYLTSRAQPVTLSAHHNASIAVPIIGDFLKRQHVRQTDPNWEWPKLCVHIKEEE